MTDPVYDQAEAAELDDVSTMQLVDINTWLPGDILVQADRMTMAHSLELRVPFLDREVMAVAGRLAREEKIGAGLWPPSRDHEAGPAHGHERGAPEGGRGAPEDGIPRPDRPLAKGDAYGFADRAPREAQTEQWMTVRRRSELLQAFRAGDRR